MSDESFYQSRIHKSNIDVSIIPTTINKAQTSKEWKITLTTNRAHFIHSKEMELFERVITEEAFEEGCHNTNESIWRKIFVTWGIMNINKE